ncbi:leucine--tRNA ligase [Striga asiatica]|uniref:Leucine--tRNA ligase n=1 Tax=Striga asiatica TaxID=4170 RepID=A0A5A7QUU8_STRAF|nr:leucine--tRNA ligase [Striga asiatica]
MRLPLDLGEDLEGPFGKAHVAQLTYSFPRLGRKSGGDSVRLRFLGSCSNLWLRFLLLLGRDADTIEWDSLERVWELETGHEKRGKAFHRTVGGWFGVTVAAPLGVAWMRYL